MSRRNLDRDRRFSARALDRYSAGPTHNGVRVRAARAGDPAEILIYDVIGADMFGEGVTAKGVLAALADANGGDVRVRVNSPGGDVFEGLAIYNALKAHPGNVTVEVDGLAASAASVIAMAGDTVTMHEGTLLMIHNASTIGFGDRREMAATAATLGKVDAQLAAIYARVSGATVEACAAMMDAETWFDAGEAVSAKLVTAVQAAPAAPRVSASASEPAPVVEAPCDTVRRLRLRLAEKG